VSSGHLSILTWNINLLTGTASTLEPLERMSPRPDVVTLQEVGLDRATEIIARLRDMGYAGVEYSGHPEASEKHYGNVIAARAQLTLCDPAALGFPWPQLVEHVLLTLDDKQINVVTVHVPNGEGNGWQKIFTLEALKQLVLTLRGKPLVLTGDFNEPRYALQDGRVVTWGQEQTGGRWVVEDGDWTDEHGVTAEWARWDRTVRWFFEGSAQSGLRNAFWDVAGLSMTVEG
jgi:exonuclease III